MNKSWGYRGIGKWLEVVNDGDDKFVCEIVFIKEVFVDFLCCIKGIVVEKDYWII